MVRAATRRLGPEGAGFARGRLAPSGLHFGVGQGHGLGQRPGVGVQGGAQDGFVGAGLDDFAQVHHRDGVADVADHGEVVADEDV